jgi:hypothetical protein
MGGLELRPPVRTAFCTTPEFGFNTAGLFGTVGLLGIWGLPTGSEKALLSVLTEYSGTVTVLLICVLFRNGGTNDILFKQKRFLEKNVFYNFDYSPFRWDIRMVLFLKTQTHS